MKRIAYFLTMALMLPLFAACSDDTEEVLDPEVTDTRVPVEWDGYDYYWCGYKQIYYYTIPGKTFIYYHINDMDTVHQKLAERGIEVIHPNPTHYTLNGAPEDWRMNFGENFDFLKDCTYEGIAADYNNILDIPEIVGACPYLMVNDQTYDFECKGTCCFCVSTTSMTYLQKIIDKYNVDLLATEYLKGGIALTWFFCGRNAKGNALEICKGIIENKLVPENVYVEPSLLTVNTFY